MLTVSSSEVSIEIDGRLALLIGYLVAHRQRLNLDGTTSGKLLILWGEDWLRCQRQDDLPPIREPARPLQTA